MRKNKLKNVAIIQELEQLFKDNYKIYQKLKLIELYLSSTSMDELFKRYYLFLDETNIPFNHLKPSRIKTIIDSFDTDNSDSGYIQPIGKNLFLKKFLEKYSSPRFLHLGEEKWTISSLSEYLKTKYFCNITYDTIRKELSNLTTYLKTNNTSTENEYEKYISHIIQQEFNKSCVYFYQLYYTSFPLRKSQNKSHNNRHSTFVGCIYGKEPNNDFLFYKSTPYFQLSSNFKTQIPNLDYYFNLPSKPGIILIHDNIDSRKIVKEYYYWYYSRDSLPPNYKVYFVPNTLYTSLSIMEEFDYITLLTQTPLLQFGTSKFNLLRKIENNALIDAFFDYCIDKNASHLPTKKTLQKK